jgi:hypothetical protein
MKHEVIRTEDGFIFKIPNDFMESQKDWRFTLLLELSLMMAKPDDFIKDNAHEN